MLKNLIRTAVPFLADLLPVPGLGNLARTAMDAVFGLDKNASDSERERAYANATPEQLLALKKEENAVRVQIKELGIREEEIHQLDRNSARKLQSRTKSVMPGFLAAVIFFGFFGMLFILAFYKIEPASKTILEIMIGSLGAMTVQIINFYFGSSKGSQDKTELLSKAT